MRNLSLGRRPQIRQLRKTKDATWQQKFSRESLLREAEALLAKE